MNTSNDRKCNHAVEKYKSVYVEGKKAFTNGVEDKDNPYKSGTKSDSDKRLAWFCGYYDNWYDSRLKYYDSLRKGTPTDEEHHSNPSDDPECASRSNAGSQ